MFRAVGILMLVPLLADSAGWIDDLLDWAVQVGAVYPAILGILVIASLGVPIPEDVPLILAGVILRTEPRAATWFGVILVSLIGIMSGDLVLYTLGKRWGRGVFNHKWVSRLVTPDRFDWLADKFHSYGVWACFFGRFLMGIRAAMCLTAGATRFPYWKFFLADFAGALLSVPFFVGVGYVCADNWELALTYMKDAQGIVLVSLAVFALVGFFWWKSKRLSQLGRTNTQTADGGTAATNDPRADLLTTPQRPDGARSVLTPVPPLHPVGGAKE